jgi:hypothetical protein
MDPVTRWVQHEDGRWGVLHGLADTSQQNLLVRPRFSSEKEKWPKKKIVARFRQFLPTDKTLPQAGRYDLDVEV